jgi:hypothetical protein
MEPYEATVADDWIMMIMVMTVIMRITLMMIANIEVLDTLYINSSV